MRIFRLHSVRVMLSTPVWTVAFPPAHVRPSRHGLPFHLLIAAALSFALIGLVAAGPASKVNYAQVQSAWAKILGFSLTIVAWHEECSGRESSPSVRQVIDSSFERWKRRNRYMDELRDRVFHRARAEGGNAEAERFANQLKSMIDGQIKSIRGEVRDGGSLDCSKFVYVLSQDNSDLAVTYSREVEIIRSPSN